VKIADSNHVTDHMDQNTDAARLGMFQYSYDAASNPLTDLATASMAKLEARRWYTYDTLNRLTDADLLDTQTWANPATVTSTYAYDDVGNRTSSTDRGGSSVGYTHDDANRMTAVVSSSQTHDLAGNLTQTAAIYSSTAYKLYYDHHNRLTEVRDAAGTSVHATFTWDALGRRIRYEEITNLVTKQYYYDGVNEVYEYDAGGNPKRYFVHGVSYIDERLAMVNTYGTTSTTDDLPYYYVVDRMYSVRFIVDRAGAIIERYCYDPYGKPLIREAPGRGDFATFGTIRTVDETRFSAALAATIWDPRADIDDDGDVDATDSTLFSAKQTAWGASPTVAQAFSDVGNPYMFQGVPHFAIDTAASATSGKYMLNHHRARFSDPVIGRWVTRDPLEYSGSSLDLQRWFVVGDLHSHSGNPYDEFPLQYTSLRFEHETNVFALVENRPTLFSDPFGLCKCTAEMKASVGGVHLYVQWSKTGCGGTDKSGSAHWGPCGFAGNCPKGSVNGQAVGGGPGWGDDGQPANGSPGPTENFPCVHECDMCGCLEDIMDTKYQHYFVTGPNSNSAAMEAAQKCGVNTEGVSGYVAQGQSPGSVVSGGLQDDHGCP